MKLTLDNRDVIDIQLDGVDSKDYPDFCDAFICDATWEDTLEALTDDELDRLTDENGDTVNQMAHESFY